MPHTTVCWAVKIILAVTASWFISVDFVYMVSEAENLMYGGF
jgi:hypothetical protein